MNYVILRGSTPLLPSLVTNSLAMLVWQSFIRRPRLNFWVLQQYELFTFYNKRNYHPSTIASFFYNINFKDNFLAEKLGICEDEDYNLIGPNLNISLKPITAESLPFLGTPDYFLSHRGFFYPRPWVKNQDFPTRGTFLSSVRIKHIDSDKGRVSEHYYSGNGSQGAYMFDLLVLFLTKIVLDKSPLSKQFKETIMPLIDSHFNQDTCNVYKCGTTEGLKNFLYLRECIINYFVFISNPSNFKLSISMNAFNCKIRSFFSSFYSPILHEWKLDPSLIKDSYDESDHNHLIFLLSNKGYANVTFNIPFANQILFVTYKGYNYLFCDLQMLKYSDSFWDINKNHSLLVPSPFKTPDIYNVSDVSSLALYLGDNEALLSYLSKNPEILKFALSGSIVTLLQKFFSEIEAIRINPKESEIVAAFESNKLKENFAAYLDLSQMYALTL